MTSTTDPVGPALTPVESLTITFLLFTKLPPGFTHELRTHLAEHAPEIDPLTGVPILDFENYCCGAHGFSALIETRAAPDVPAHRTLFDTGPESKSLARNLAAMHIDPGSIARVVLSHWHSDHTGGLLSLLDRRAPDTPCIVDVHPARPLRRGIAPPGHATPICALKPDPTFAEIEARGARVEAHAQPHVVAGGTVYVSGEIPRVTEWETGVQGGMRWVEDGAAQGRWASEAHIMDERYVAVDVLGKGLVLFSACSHAGIVNVVRHAVATFRRPIHMIVGGLHLAPPDHAPRVAPTVHFLARALRPAPAYILPMHCTGFGAKVALEHALGEGVVPAGVGHKVVVKGSMEDEQVLARVGVEVDMREYEVGRDM